MDEQKPDQADIDDAETLEDIPTSVEPKSDTAAADSNDIISAESNNPLPVGPPPKPPLSKRLLSSLLSFNIYFLLFIFVLVVAGVIVLFSYNYSKKKSSTTGIVSTTSLSQSTLDQLANSDASVGNSGQVLNVQSSAVFAGKILARSDLEVAGNLQLGGDLNLPNIIVSDTAALGQVTVSKNLAVSGNAAIQGQETIAQSLQVGGNGNFSGSVTAPQIATNSLQLNGDLNLTHHINAGGGTPGRSAGNALGSGGTSTVSGSDTAGSVSINTGSSPNAGCFITINFTAKFNATPHVLVTPIGSAAGGIAYYINRSSTSFSICSSSTPPASTSFGFDYFVLD